MERDGKAIGVPFKAGKMRSTTHSIHRERINLVITAHSAKWTSGLVTLSIE